jgi:hypothetical protein
MSISRTFSIFIVLLGFLTSIVLLGFANPISDLRTSASDAPPAALRFNDGLQTRGMLTWNPLGNSTQSNGCTDAPATCYPATGMPAEQLAVLVNAGVGHLRIGIEVGPMLHDPANVTGTYLPNIFKSVGVILNAGLKVSLAFAATTTFSPYTPDYIFGGGPGGKEFLAYISLLESIANYIAAHPTVCPPKTCMVETFNETPGARNVRGGINAQYRQLKMMFQAYRSVLPEHTISLCLTGYCSLFDLVRFHRWKASDFDSNTTIQIHPYIPPVAALACTPGSIYRDLCSVAVYPPTNSASDYNAAKMAYEARLAADNTWAADCPAGPNCRAARDANKAVMEGAGHFEGLACYYGQGRRARGPGGINCVPGQQQDLTWLTSLYGLVTAWLPRGVTARQIYVGEFGVIGAGPNGSGVGVTGQAALLADQTKVFNRAGFSWCVIGVSYNINYAAFGLTNENRPFKFISPEIQAALGFNGQ